MFLIDTVSMLASYAKLVNTSIYNINWFHLPALKRLQLPNITNAQNVWVLRVPLCNPPAPKKQISLRFTTQISLTQLIRQSSYFALCKLKGAWLDEGGLDNSLVVCGPAANVCAWGVQTETGALQGGKHGVSQRWVVGFWVVITHLIHPALKKVGSKGQFQSTLCTLPSEKKKQVIGIYFGLENTVVDVCNQPRSEGCSIAAGTDRETSLSGFQHNYLLTCTI